MSKDELIEKIESIHESLIMADEFGSDHIERKAMRIEFEEIKDELISLCNSNNELLKK